MKKVLISGGSGFVGRALCNFLDDKGYEIAILSRKKNIGKYRTFQWKPAEHYIDINAIEFADVIINLAGENVSGGRWTSNRKSKIYDSRIESSKLIADGIVKSENKPKTFISASAIGIYGTNEREELQTEDSIPANDFLAKVVNDWEAQSSLIRNCGVDTKLVRIGVVLDPEGGALKKMMPIFKLGLGSPLGSGKQIMPWIALEDLVSIFHYLMENKKLNGCFNAVAPEIIDNAEFSRLLAKNLKKPYFMPAVPAFVLKLMFGEMSQIILSGNKISSQKIIDAGFKFKYDKLEEYFKDMK